MVRCNINNNNIDNNNNINKALCINNYIDTSHCHTLSAPNDDRLCPTLTQPTKPMEYENDSIKMVTSHKFQFKKEIFIAIETNIINQNQQSKSTIN